MADQTKINGKWVDNHATTHTPKIISILVSDAQCGTGRPMEVTEFEYDAGHVYDEYDSDPACIRYVCPVCGRAESIYL